RERAKARSRPRQASRRRRAAEHSPATTSSGRSTRAHESGELLPISIVAMLIRPDGGSARVLGCDVQRDAGALRERIGLAGQYAAVDENLTGLENLAM